MMLYRVAVAFIFMLPVSISAVYGSDHVMLNSSEIRALFSGNTLYAESRLKQFEKELVRNFEIHLREDGSLVIRNFDGNTDGGEWTVTDEGLFCNQYQHTRRGRHKCFEVHQLDEQYRLWDVDAQRITSVFTVRAGNPEEL